MQILSPLLPEVDGMFEIVAEDHENIKTTKL